LKQLDPRPSGSKILGQLRVEFDGGDAIRTLQQFFRQRTAPWANLDHKRGMLTASSCRDALQCFAFDKEVLPELLAGHF